MDTYSPKPTSDTVPASPESNSANVPQLPPANPLESGSQKSGWLHSRAARIALAAVAVLLILGALSPHKHRDMSHQTAGKTTKPTSSTVAQLAPVNGLSSAQISNTAPVNEKSYFNTVWTHLDTIGTLSQSMNVSCSVKFPPPEPCASDIAAFQAELLKTKADLDQVSAPAAFDAADATLRSALNADIQATNDALAALQARNLTKWLVAVNEHAVAGKQLDLAGTQALDVLN